ncbi:hypothetical protein Acr_04g0006280 [Actinidia rufa]|uniref:CCHC-type domain-containing protein n=1 Tax=Actinidia rufa TaxID=165716 RepID=A0A7J0EHN9_9ERIC|nr:hypothetical protein Acr_04g0006280 [Actinidia rufa]
MASPRPGNVCFLAQVITKVVPLVETDLQHQTASKTEFRTCPHAPPEHRRVRSVSATCSHAPGEGATRPHAPRGGNHVLQSPIHTRQRSHAREGNSRAREATTCAPSQHLALVSEGSGERGRGQGRGHHRGTGKERWKSQARGRTARCFYCDQEGHIKRDCPKYKAQDQSSEIAATAVMAVDEDESDVLLAVWNDGKSDWILDSGNAYHLCRDRKVFSTYAACEGRIWMANNMSNRVVGRGNSQSFQGKQGDAVGKEDWRGVSRQNELLFDMGPVVLARRVDKGSNRCTEVRKASAGVPRGFGVVQERREMLWDMYGSLARHE